MKWQKQSFMLENGKRISYISQLGGYGLGYIYDQKIYKSAGNGYYEDITEKVKEYYIDDGKKYIEKIQNIGLFPSHKIK